ncbi:head-tail connector protein [Phytohabitans aurantiacus]|uniref:Phage gp6-like head-tail connector protein n=1 Tax=Phytohabitans aurantiacus TaxID=3016789 RepID=A0ABQ5R179_9ACTN|nr:head-tail connector protein [Phytohabitans aurantiacus]GLI00311.1 hypothetical protein Pa4123_55870 [Phytohabitans aurantiacus]
MAWAPDYVTSAELKAFLRISDTDDDAQVALAITAASRAVDTHCGRQFGVVAAAEQRFYTGQWDRRICRWVVVFDDLMSTTNFAAIVQDEDGVTVGTIDEYALEPRNAAAKGRPWTQMVVLLNSAQQPTGARDEVAVTALWGWSAVPSAVKQATLLQASRIFARRQSPYGIAGSPDDGSEMRLLARVDPDVAVVLNPYRRWWAAA